MRREIKVPTKILGTGRAGLHVSINPYAYLEFLRQCHHLPPGTHPSLFQHRYLQSDFLCFASRSVPRLLSGDRTAVPVLEFL